MSPTAHFVDRAAETEPGARHQPPCLTGDLPPAGGRVGPEPGDFRVDEIPSYEPSGSGPHWYVRLEKRSMTTPQLVDVVGKIAEVSPREIGYAGLKDKHAVTRQWLSLPERARPPETWELPGSVTLLEHSRHSNKLRTGHLSGNRFEIRLIDVPEGGLDRARAITRRIEEAGLPNYFGAQRFGSGEANLEKALGWLRAGASARLPAFLVKLYPSVAQAEVFNRYLSLRRELDWEKPLAGDVARLDGSSASFVVEDPEREAPRLRARDIHLTGPILGPKTKPAGGRPAELEKAAIEGAGLDEKATQTLFRFAPGTRRDLSVFPADLEMTETGPGELVLRVGLPAGSYVTELLRELLRSS